MKRYGNLYPQVWDMDNIREAHRNARRGKAHYKEVKMVDADPEKYFSIIQEQLKAKTYKTSQYTVFTRRDQGKERVIYRLPYFPDRIVHHCIMQVVEPIWTKVFIRDTYSSLKHRGVHDGVKRIHKAIRSNPEGTKYCLKMDVKKFYPSINHSVLRSIVRKKIKDPDLLWILDEAIKSNPEGVPIGNYLSQYFGNLYLTDLDHWIKETLRCKYYYRYCDDLVILHHDKAFLHTARKRIEEKLGELKLILKGNWQVFPVESRGVDFLGYKFYQTHTLLRKRVAKQMVKRLTSVKNHVEHLDPIKLLSCVMSYHGWQKHANAWNLFTKHLPRDLVNTITHKCNKPTLKGIFE